MKVLVITGFKDGIFGENLQRVLNSFSTATVFGLYTLKNYHLSKGRWHNFGKRIGIYIIYPILILLVLIIKKYDYVVCATNPFYMPIFCATIGKLRGTKVIMWAFDLYPEALGSASVIKKSSYGYALLKDFARFQYQCCNKVICLGNVQKKYLHLNYNLPNDKISVIPIGPDHSVAPTYSNFCKDDTRESYNVNYIGSMGRMHDYESVRNLLKYIETEKIEIAGSPVKSITIHIGFYGSGNSVERLKREFKNLDVWNKYYYKEKIILVNFKVKFKPFLETEQFIDVLKETDLSLATISKKSGVVVVPSKVYNAILYRIPLLALCPNDSELAEMITSYKLGLHIVNEIALTQPSITRNMIIELFLDPVRYRGFTESIDEYFTKYLSIAIQEKQWKEIISHEL